MPRLPVKPAHKRRVRSSATAPAASERAETSDAGETTKNAHWLDVIGHVVGAIETFIAPPQNNISVPTGAALAGTAPASAATGEQSIRRRRTQRRLRAARDDDDDEPTGGLAQQLRALEARLQAVEAHGSVAAIAPPSTGHAHGTCKDGADADGEDAQIDIENGGMTGGDSGAAGADMARASRLLRKAFTFRSSMQRFAGGAPVEAPHAHPSSSNDAERVENTATYHMWAVAVACDADPAERGSYMLMWLATLGSIGFVCMQTCVLGWVIFGVSHPTCTAHADSTCDVGFFCLNPHVYPSIMASHGTSGAYSILQQYPRCFDCAQFWVPDVFTPAAVAHGRRTAPGETSASGGAWSPAVMGHYNLTDELCTQIVDSRTATPQMDVAFQRIIPAPWMTNSKLAEQAAVLDSPERLAMHCASYVHCRDTDIWPHLCDHLWIDMMEVHPTQVVLLFIIGLMLAVPLSQDMDQAAVEEAVLAFHTRNRPWHFSHSLLRAGLRIRRFILPVTTAAAGAGVVMAESLAASSILLNVLAVSFVTELDDMVAAIIVSPSQSARAEPWLAVPDGRPWLAERVRGIVCSISMCLVVHKSPELVAMMPIVAKALRLEPDEIGDLPCNRTHEAIQFILYLSPITFIAMHAIRSSMIASHGRYLRQALLRFVFESCSCGSANCLSMTFFIAAIILQGSTLRSFTINKFPSDVVQTAHVEFWMIGVLIFLTGVVFGLCAMALRLCCAADEPGAGTKATRTAEDQSPSIIAKGRLACRRASLGRRETAGSWA